MKCERCSKLKRENTRLHKTVAEYKRREAVTQFVLEKLASNKFFSTSDQGLIKKVLELYPKRI